MNKKEQRLSIVGLIFSIFLFLCAVIDLVNGHILGAFCALCAGIFFSAVSYRNIKRNTENKQ